MSTGGVLESIAVFRKPLMGGAVWEFHVHWEATNGGHGCKTKSFARTLIEASPTDTLARLGLSEQALTGNALDPVEVKLILNFQRTRPLGVEVLAQIPGSSMVIPIPVIDRENLSHPAPPSLN